MTHRLLVRALVMVVTAALMPGLLVVAAAPAAAATCASARSWTDASGDHLWTTPANWSPVGAPQSTDAVRIDIPGATVNGATGMVCDLSLSGALAVADLLTVSGVLSATTGSVVTLADSATLGVAGSATLADTVAFRRPTGASGLTPLVRVTGPLTMDGTTTFERVGLALVSGGSIRSGSSPATVAGTGTLSWQGGSLGGSLTLASPVIVSGGGDRQVESGSRLAITDTATVTGTRVVLGAQAQLSVTGVVTLAGAPVGVVRSGSALEGQSLTVAAGGAVQRVAGTVSEAAVIDVPVVNRGSVTVSGRLDVPAGYRQEEQPDAQVEPVTGLLSSTSLLTTTDAAGTYGDLQIQAGGLGGLGAVAADTLTVGAAWLHPGFAASAGTLTVRGDLVLTEDSELQLFMRGAEPEKRDRLVVEGLGSNGTVVSPGRATLAGRISGRLGDGYQPAYGTTVTDVVRYAARTGAFEPVRSITSSGLGWAPRYDDSLKDGDGRGVDIRYLDVAPPTIGIAGVPAFTQLPSQQLTYDGVDNRTGVASFDVRWRKATGTTAFTRWRSPKAWRHTTARSQTLRGLDPGGTYCFAVRARDGLGNVSPWSRPQCVARMSDDRALRASAAWSRSGGQAGFYASTFTRTSVRGATMQRRGTFTRVAVTALRCRQCGTLGVYSGTTLVRTLPLTSKRTAPRTWVSKVLTGATGPLVLRVVSTGKPVTVDAVGLLR